jgi:hypothetical protein
MRFAGSQYERFPVGAASLLPSRGGGADGQVNKNALKHPRLPR